jgi:UDP-N-acetylmuramoyl-tripeptide--D-alanyl-D-alanine ligase
MVVLTCLGEEHLEGLGDLAGVAAEECAILRQHAPQGLRRGQHRRAEVVHQYLPPSGVHITTFGPARRGRPPQPSDVRGALAALQLNERFGFRLRMLVGAHNAVNAAGAVAIARRFGLDYDEAAARLESFVLPPMRNEILEFAGVTLINDAYNANPQSVAAALDVLRAVECRGRRIVVFGEMRELGPRSAELHRAVAEQLRSTGVQRVLLVGDSTDPMQEILAGEGGLFGPAVERCSSVEACLEKLATTVQPGDVILLKGSRAIELERVVEPLRQRLSTAAQA